MTALLLIGACQWPSNDPALLAAIASEASDLKRAYPTRSGEVTDVPPKHWPKTIADLGPEQVQIFSDSVEIRTRSGFDGGWGYGVAASRDDLTMLPECWRQVADTVFWHGPC